jgi:hypothetical protein
VRYFALVLNVEFRTLGLALNEMVGGIYSPQPLSSRWLFLLSMGAPDSHCSLTGARHVSSLIRVLELLTVGPLCLFAAPDRPVLHRTVR